MGEGGKSAVDRLIEKQKITRLGDRVSLGRLAREPRPLNKGIQWGRYLVREVKRLRRRSPKRGQRSLREISAALSGMGFKNANGQPFSASSIKAMIEAKG
jgi:hypothetical protein